ncbi:MAG TPA: hypothetical protein VD963_01405 [Phycisphaerales bacterium]|nr:hypothetical protein [Phycisphaerales bacterium]
MSTPAPAETRGARARSWRRAGWVLALASLGVMGLSVWAMARRAAEFNRSAEFSDLLAEPVVRREFSWAGRTVRLADGRDGAGRHVLRLHYGDRAELIRAKEPPVRDLADLGLYKEWLAVLRLRPRAPQPMAGDSPGTAAGPSAPGERLVIVNRLTPEGFDPETWGSVRRAEWRFEIIELEPGGAITRRLFRWPRTERGEKSLARQAAEPGAAPHVLELARLEPLRERTWEYQAALFAMPTLNVPKYKFQGDAVSALGWTLPAAGFSVLGLLAGLGMALAPGRRAGGDAAPPQGSQR